MSPFDLGPHAAFILIAYGLAIITVVGLTAWVFLDHRAQLRQLAELEKRGVTRRSERRSAASAAGPAEAT